MLALSLAVACLVAPRAWLLAQADQVQSAPAPSAVTANTAGDSSDQGATAAEGVSDPSALVSDARLLIEAGKLDEAEQKLRTAIRRNPEDRNAFYYLSLIEEARYTKQAREREIAQKDAIPSALAPGNASASKAGDASAGRKLIYKRLDQIVVEEVLYDGLPLREVVRDLNDVARRRDPDQRGVNIIINPDADSGAPEQTTSGRIDPVTGQPLPPQSTADAVIRLHLRKARLLDVIDAVAKVAEVPLRYSVEDYAVVFSPRSAATEPLFTRSYKLDPDRFAQGVRQRAGNLDILEGLRTLFANAGVEFGTNSVVTSSAFGDAGFPSPKAAFYNNRTGLLLVRATLADLDAIEKVVQICNIDPPQVVIEIKFAELGADELHSFGLDQPSDLQGSDSQLTVTNWNGVVTDPRAFEPGQALQSFIHSKPLLLPGRALILTDAQTRLMLKHLAQAGGDILAAPRITTLSGRQAQVQVVDVKSIVLLDETNTSPNRASGSFFTRPLPLGPCVDVFPQVIDFISQASNKTPWTIDLTAIPSWTEFLGYDAPGPFKAISDSAGLPVVDQKPLPHFRVRQSTLRASVPNGHTLIAVGFGEVPGSGTKPPAKPPKQLVILITPTIIDAAGNPIGL
jgi:type II secretory pathway component GspD/PulD (secretin)